MESVIVTTMLTGIGALVGTFILCTVAVMRHLRQGLLVQEAIHKAVNSNYQDMLRQNETQAVEIKLQTRHILELNTRLTTLLGRWPADRPEGAEPEDEPRDVQNPGDRG